MKITQHEGIFNLGANNPSALKRFANRVQGELNDKGALPSSPFVEWVVDRITGDSLQDLIMVIQGRRGSGKSYSSLYLAKRLAEGLAAKEGGNWSDYLNIENNVAALADTNSIMGLLNNPKENQIYIVDDAGIAISNRAWASIESRNFIALTSVIRTKRSILILSVPLQKNLDNQFRQMIDVSATVYKSMHAGGFNILKMTSMDVGIHGKEYQKRLSFGGRKIDFWACGKPDADISAKYDVIRKKSALDLNKMICETGSYKPSQKKTGKKNRIADVVAKNADEVRKLLASGMSQRKVRSHLGITDYQLLKCLNYQRGEV